ATLGKAEPAAKIDIYIPDRASEGYGLKKSALKNLANKGAKLIITVDNATRNVDEVAYAKTLGLDIIITDHHEPGDILPNCLIINPKIGGETYPFLGLAGCGVAFKVAQALLTSPLTPLLKKGEGKEPRSNAGRRGEVFLKWLLDLVAIGTIADLVPLIDENRVLTKYGLVVLNKTKRVGLKKLIAVARSGVDKNGQNREIDSWQVGFQLAPRLNAAGRLDHANSAYELLVTADEVEADKIAKQLNATNQERQRLTEEIFQYADTQVNQADKILLAVEPGLRCHCEKSRVARDDEAIPSSMEIKTGLPRSPLNALALMSGSLAMTEQVWPAGVMGLVAGKLTEKYYRPALAITDKNGLASASDGLRRSEEIVGSGRSIAEFDITAMLEECAEFLANFGGHKQACGFTLKSREMLEPFLAKAKEIAAAKLTGIELS
ncbi:MAG: DHH family phosphoesterase, partial [Patescibacteria group bacterium]